MTPFKQDVQNKETMKTEDRQWFPGAGPVEAAKEKGKSKGCPKMDVMSVFTRVNPTELSVLAVIRRCSLRPVSPQTGLQLDIPSFVLSEHARMLPRAQHAPVNGWTVWTGAGAVRTGKGRWGLLLC